MEGNSMRHFWKLAGTLLVIALAITRVSSAQDNSKASSSAPSAAYPNTVDGLNRLLQDVRDAAKRGDKEKVAAFLKNMEIPNCDAWLHEMYPSDKADSWMDLCKPESLTRAEMPMQQKFEDFGRSEGNFAIRKVNDHPEPDQGMESGWLQIVRKPLDIYFASWHAAQSAPGGRGEPVGYFIFVDNAFRWYSIIWFPKLGTLHAKIVPPQLIYRVDPIYPCEAKAQHITGTVRVYYVIGGDGKVYNAHALSHPGLSEDPSLRKAAEDAILQWKYKPGTMDGKPIEMNAITIDVIFGPDKIEIRPF